ncbi:MAG TPA: formylglycine-generating enzyme family protein [Gaiellaceae bacterium]|nr:formylglycine-generating enzyme family protein [Gaiellaceae bacterium]
MVWIPGGEFLMGSDRHYPEEAPAHRVSVDSFWMDRFQVTNEQFARFVGETGHITVAERPPDPADYPGAKPEFLVPASSVFIQPRQRVELTNQYNWWTLMPGADWRHPRGPGSDIEGLAEHPVVHVAWDDVEAYARWADKELPTEAEWEFAARGGLDGAEFVWGDEFTPRGEYLANTWQGEFPLENELRDGFEWTAPVGSFSPNGYGLYDMAGNAWEWTSDWFQAHERILHACCTVSDPRGGDRERSYDPNEFAHGLRIPRKVMKGGSHLCAANFCSRYRPAARMPQPLDTSTSHLGFRCVVRPS